MQKKSFLLIIVIGVFISLHAQMVTSYDSIKIVVGNAVPIDNLQMRSDQDTLLQVAGKQSYDGNWVPVSGDWIYNATNGNTYVSGRSSWRFSPGDTGTGIIVVVLDGAMPDTIRVKILPGLPNTLPRQCLVSLKYYDVRGRLVASFVNQAQGPGYYALPLPLSAWSRGTYVQVFSAGSFIKNDRVVVVR